jgi:hypothetical protein
VSADKKEVVSSPGLKPVAGTSKQVFRFVARQPILNREQQVFGYALLFRDGIENFFRATDINCTRDLLLKDGIICSLPARRWSRSAFGRRRPSAARVPAHARAGSGALAGGARIRRAAAHERKQSRRVVVAGNAVVASGKQRGIKREVDRAGNGLRKCDAH